MIEWWEPSSPTPDVWFVPNVKSYGAKGDGVADDTAPVQAAINSAGPTGEVRFPAGTFRVKGLKYVNNLRLVGAGPGATTLRLDPDEEGSLLGGTFSMTGIGSNVPVEDVYLEGITFDGDKDNSNLEEADPAGALFHAYSIRRFHALRCNFINGRGYGLGLQGRPESTVAKRGPVSDIYLEKCRILNNGLAAGSSDGLDVKSCERATLIDCYAAGNADHGYDIRGRHVRFLGCTAENNVVAGFSARALESVTTTTTLTVAINASVTEVPLVDASFLPPQGNVIIGSERISYSLIEGNTLTGCERSSGRGAAASHSEGATVAFDDSESWTKFIGCSADNNLGHGIAISATGNADHRCEVIATDARENGQHGLICAAPGSTGVVHLNISGGFFDKNTLRGLQIENAFSCTVNGSQAHGNGSDGIRFIDQANGAKVTGPDLQKNTGFAIKSEGTSDSLNIATVRVKENTGGGFSLVGTNNRGASIDTDQSIGPFSASASMSFGVHSNYWIISGSSTITTIAASHKGRVLTLRFTSTASLENAGVLKLDEKFTGPGQIQLVCDGENWYEL
ncbi:MAG TPA: right-handed parallel beta-helix repeat-containing protein [Solirubrobacterales bacterium]|nr:right-handed parallel beta-helix repeat-containing protein [Solirubrobacterales bacterium]